MSHQHLPLADHFVVVPIHYARIDLAMSFSPNMHWGILSVSNMAIVPREDVLPVLLQCDGICELRTLAQPLQLTNSIGTQHHVEDLFYYVPTPA